MDKLLSSTGSDLTARTGRFNLVSGAVTMLMGIASSLSVATRGFFFRLAGHSLAFVIFAALAGVATILAWYCSPKPSPQATSRVMTRRSGKGQATLEPRLWQIHL